MTQKEMLATRLAQLEKEHQEGTQHLSTKEQEVASLKETLLRISGAIAVLKEEIAKL